MREFFKKNNAAVIVALFAAFLAVFAVLDAVIPDRERSELENRELAKSPALTFDTLISGRFSAKYEEYINDQFILRDFWIDVKSA